MSGRTIESGVDHGNRYERQRHDDRHERLPSDAESPRAQGREHSRHQLDDRVARRNRLRAVGAFSAKQQVADDRYVLPGPDLVATGRAARPRRHEVEATVGEIVLRRVPRDFLALGAPLPFHHDWQTMNDDIQKAADHEAESEYHGDEQQRGFGEDFGHENSPSGLLLAYTKTASAGHSGRRLLLT